MATRIAPSGALAPFRLPRDRKALASFLIAAVGGAIVAFFPGPPDAASLWLLLSMAGLVLVSEWISNLMGRGRDGVVPSASGFDVRGIIVSAGCIALGVAFLWRLPPAERRSWLAVLSALASGVALLFLLRIEWVPLDRRLIALTHLLLTAPCLLLGFRAWGIGAPRAFTAWAPLALFLPSVALIERAWMDGPSAARNSLTAGLLPVLVGTAGLALRGQWPLAAFLALWAVRAGTLVLRRRADDAGTMPSFRAMRAFGRETCGWIGGFVAVWLGTWLGWG